MFSLFGYNGQCFNVSMLSLCCALMFNDRSMFNVQCSVFLVSMVNVSMFQCSVCFRVCTCRETEEENTRDGRVVTRSHKCCPYVSREATSVVRMCPRAVTSWKSQELSVCVT